MTPLEQITMLERVRDLRTARVRRQFQQQAQAAQDAEVALAKATQQTLDAAEQRKAKLEQMGHTVGPLAHLWDYEVCIETHATSLIEETQVRKKATSARDAAKLAQQQAENRYKMAQRGSAKTTQIRDLVATDVARENQAKEERNV